VPASLTRTVVRERQGGHVAEMQRRRLLLALGELVGEAGIEEASVGRICKRAGVSRRTFYDLFDDREACLLALIDHTVERLGESVAAACADEHGWLERLRASLTVLLMRLDDEPGLARLCVVETLRAGPAVLERRRAVLERLAAAVDEGRTVGKGEPPPLTAESTIGGVAAVVHARLVTGGREPLADLAPSLMSMIVHPYLGSAAARRELARRSQAPPRRAVSKPCRQGGGPAAPSADPFRDLHIRLTFRTARVLSAVGARPGASNREVGRAAGVADQGQMSKLLRRLEDAALIENDGHGQPRGERNAWRLTARGRALLGAVGEGIDTS
jgi:AcrR family transcriptional regulator